MRRWVLGHPVLRHAPVVSDPPVIACNQYGSPMSDSSDPPTCAPANDQPDNPAADWWLDDQVRQVLADEFQKHMLGLGVVYRTEGVVHTALVTGFVIEREGFLLWITAGHCIEDLQELAADPNHKIISTRWYDPPDDLSGIGLPTPLSEMAWRRGVTEEFDVGVVFLRGHEVDLLRANKSFSPMGAEMWTNCLASAPEVMFVVGYAEQWIEATPFRAGGQDGVTMRAGMAVVPVVKVLNPDDHAGEGAFWSRKSCIYANVHLGTAADPHFLQSVKGMSGGPVLSVNRMADGGIETRLWGIQSCCADVAPETIRAESFANLSHSLDVLFDEARSLGYLD